MVDLGKHQHLVVGWLLLCFINTVYEKVIRVHFFSYVGWTIGFSVGVL